MRFVLPCLAAMLLAFNLAGEDHREFVSLDRDVLADVEAQLSIEKHFTDDKDAVLIGLPASDLDSLAQIIHQAKGRCGGFIIEKDRGFSFHRFMQSPPLSRYAYPSPRGEQEIKTQINTVSSQNILDTIAHLSSFRNRYYRSVHGENSQKWLASHWQNLTEDLPNASVELYSHSDYRQSSVILTIEGTSQADEIVVIGGHGDSIAGWYPSPDVHAPGADDNASGIASITELIRVLAESQFRPQRTLKFISYAAEEVGLRGSYDIATEYRRQGKNIVAVMQLDMTGYEGSDYDIVLMEDYTDSNLTSFVKQLITSYLPEIRWTTDKCGYACSDHASWTRNNYPAVMPFESKMDDYNSKIHSRGDTLDQLGNRAEHAVNFAKLAVAFAMELAKASTQVGKL